MKVLDIILTEGAAGQASERVLKSILGHSTWSAAQKLAFKESVDLCTDAIEKMILRDVDLKSPQATREAWAAIEPRLKDSVWAKDKEFIQEIFTVSKVEAEERVAKKAAELHGTPKEEPKPSAKDEPKDTNKPKTKLPSTVWGKVDSAATWTIWGSNAAIAAVAIKDYNDRRAYAEAVMDGRATQNGKTVVWTPEQAQDYARQAHLALIGTLAGAILIPTAIVPATLGTIKFIAAVIPRAKGFITSNIAAPFANMIKWEEMVGKLVAKGYTKEQAIAYLAKNGVHGEKLNAAFKTAWASFVASQFAVPLGAGYKIPVGERTGAIGDDGRPLPAETIYKEMSPREILVMVALKLPFWNTINSYLGELIANGIEQAWNGAISAVGITGAEYTSFSTDLKRMSEKLPQSTTPGPAQKQTQQPAATAPAATPPNVQKRTDGVEVKNW